MRYRPILFEPPWQPEKIVGNTAYYYNPETGVTRSEFVPNSEISERKKEFADWYKIHSKFRARSGKGTVYVPKTEYIKLSRDPFAPFDFSNISKRQGTVTKVLSANRLVIDGSFVVTVPGIQIPPKRTNPKEYEAARKWSEEQVLGKQVYISINMNNPYTPTGDIRAHVDFDPTTKQVQEAKEALGWNVFEYLNVPGFAFGATVRNIAIYRSTGEVGKTTIGGRYSLSDTFTFTRLYHQIKGDAKDISLYGKGETEGAWYDKLFVDIFGDPSNLVSIGGKGVFVANRKLLSGAQYMKPINRVVASVTKAANKFSGHINIYGGSTIDDVNRLWRRGVTLLSPAYYFIMAQLDVFNAVWYGGMNPLRYRSTSPILKQARNPIYRNEIVLRVANNPRGGYTAAEIEAFFKEFPIRGTSAGMGDVASAPGKSGGVWQPLINQATWIADQSRSAMFIDGLKKGLAPDAAFARMKHFLFDFDARNLTAFEQAYINRIIPFYIPQSRNIALMVEQSLKTPYKTTSIAKWQIQQRQFAGDDQFKDYDKNTIIQKIGDGKYIQIRHPLEDIYRLPGMFSSKRKALLSSTYPIYTVLPELYEDRNYFDDSRPSSFYPEYFAKKFASRLYYMDRDLSNPNKSLSDKIFKQMFGIGVITPDNRRSYEESLIDAGFSPTFARMEAESTMKRQQYFSANAAKFAAQAQIQASLPEDKQMLPSDNDLKLGLESAQYPQFAWTAGRQNLIAWMMGNKSEGGKTIKDRIHPSEQYGKVDRWLFNKYARNGINESDLPSNYFKIRGYSLRDVRNVLGEYIDDPLNVINWVGAAGRVLKIDGKVHMLSKLGRQTFASMNPVVASGRAEGLYGKQAAIRMNAEAEARFMEYLSHNPGVAGSLVFKPGLRMFGRTLITQTKFQSALKIAKLPITIPAKVGKVVAEEAIIKPIQEFAEKKIITIGEHHKKVLKWRDDLQKKFIETDASIKSQKKASRIQINDLMDEAERKAGVWKSANIRAKLEPTKGFFSHLSDTKNEYQVKLTDWAEHGKGSADAQGVVDEFIRNMELIANAETKRGITKHTITNYVSHIITKNYKILKGYTDPVGGKFAGNYFFTQKRRAHATIAEQNARVYAKHHILKYEPSLRKIWIIRKAQHIEAVELQDFLIRVKSEQGVPKTWWRYLQNSYAVSDIKYIDDVLLPVETIRALEKNPLVRAHYMTLKAKPGIAIRALDKYDAFTYWWRRNLTVRFNPRFVPRNFISSIHQNIMGGMYDVTKYFSKKDPTGISVITDDGRRIYNWEMNAMYTRAKIYNQPGILEGVHAPTSQNVLDNSGSWGRQLTVALEAYVRKRLFDAKIREGFTEAQADAAVKAMHLDYTQEMNWVMRTASRFLSFPAWTFGVPGMITTAIIERPAQFAAMPKTMDVWNSPSDKIMLNARPEWMQNKLMFKLPGTDDAFLYFPFATNDFFEVFEIFNTKEKQFYWDHAKTNPNVLLKFARFNLDIPWLKNGGGSAKNDRGGITITYGLTGETIRAHLTPRNTMVFVDGNTNLVIAEYEVTGEGNRKAIVTEGEPLNELLHAKFLPWWSIGVDATRYLLRGEQESNKFKFPDTGDPDADAWILFLQLVGLSAMENSVKQAIDKETPQWEKDVEFFGMIGIWHAHQSIAGAAPTNIKAATKKALRRVEGNYHGCGF